MEIILSIIGSMLAVSLFMILIEGLPKSITYWLEVRRYNYVEPNKLLGFKKAIFASDSPLPMLETFTLGNWNYYHYSGEVFNYKENVSLVLYKYDKAIIWHWIRTHNNELKKKK